MKRTLILFALLSSFAHLHSQSYDLLVTTKGDSIACQIDSILNEVIYFEMKFRNNWIHTQINKSQVRDYKLLAISKETAKFKTGTSILKSKTQTSTSNNIRKNSFGVENMLILPAINYDRIVSINDKTGIVLKVGLSFDGELFVIAESSLLFGSKRHFLELGGGYGGKNLLGLYGRFGYRYISEKGLMIKGGVHIVKNVPVFPTIGIGFSFY